MNSITIPTKLLVIDDQISNWQSLVSSVSAGTAVLVLNAHSDGLNQINDYLTQLNASAASIAPLQSIHILSHGSSGRLLLGNSAITLENLSQYRQQLSELGSALDNTGDVLLYGCNVAEGDTGLQFIEALAQSTGADVAASNDLTGSATLGGNWLLEASTGSIEAEMTLYNPKLNNYNGVLTVADITNLSFNSGFSPDGLTPLLDFSVELSSNFSNTNSIQLLYWAVNNEQTWITLTRNSINQPFTATIELPLYAKSGSYEIRDFQVTDNTGTFVAVSKEQLIERGFNVYTNLVNPLSDDQAPSLDSVSVGSHIIASDGTIHLAVEVNASDSSSGLNQNFVLEITSPSGASLQQWATFDANGHAIVDFALSPYSASGDYHINTIRLTDLAGNYNDSQSWLRGNSAPIEITNPNQDIIAPEIQSFALEAVFDPITDRPKIVISGVVTDDISGVNGVYLRINSPAGSSAFLDTWVYEDYYSQPGTNQKTVQLDNYLALTTDFLPGEYSVNYLRLGDAANNEVYLNGYNLSLQALQETVRVYFPDPLHNLGQTTVNASEQSDFVFGSDKLDDHLFANAGDDIIYSGLGDDYLFGGVGADILYAGSGNDVVDAGAGNDLIVGGDGEGNDIYVGDDGFDTIKYVSAVADITVNLLNGTAFATAGGDAAHIGVDSLRGIEGIISGNYNDTLIGSNDDNDINGEAGNDTITGGGGNDNINGGDGSDTAVFSGTYTNYTKSFNSIINQYTLIANSGNDGTDIVSNIEFFTFSDRTVAVSNLLGSSNAVPTGIVTITGTTTQGQQLTASNTLADADGLGTISYQWFADGQEISGATAATLKLAQAQVSKVVTVQASYTDLLGTKESVLSAATEIVTDVAKVNNLPTGSVIITGTAKQNKTLTASNTLADADGLGTISYQWFADGQEISGAATTNLFLEQALVGKAIAVQASYLDNYGANENSISLTTKIVENVNDTPSGKVIITGSPFKNQTLMANYSLEDKDGLGSISYQWFANGKPIKDATEISLTLAQTHVRKLITVGASYTDSWGTDEFVLSSATDKISVSDNHLPQGKLTISGNPRQNTTLKAVSSLTDADGLGTINYQWFADGQSISGATTNTLKLTQKHVNKALTVQVSYTDLLGSNEKVISPATQDVININDKPTGKVIVSGSTIKSETLSVSNTLKDVDGIGNISYQWLANSKVIKNAIATTFTLTNAQVNKTISVQASYTDLLGTNEKVISEATAKVTNVVKLLSTVESSINASDDEHINLSTPNSDHSLTLIGGDTLLTTHLYLF